MTEKITTRGHSADYQWGRLQTEDYEMFSQFLTKFNQNSVDWCNTSGVISKDLKNSH